jgi:hypothetical protein
MSGPHETIAIAPKVAGVSPDREFTLIQVDVLDSETFEETGKTSILAMRTSAAMLLLAHLERLQADLDLPRAAPAPPSFVLPPKKDQH